MTPSSPAACDDPCVIARRITFLLLFFFALTAQAATYRGLVQSQFLGPLANVPISVSNGTTLHTDFSGRFAIEADQPPVVTIAIAGFSTVTVPMNLAGTVINLIPLQTSEQITVTANRTPTRLADTPASVVVISGETIAASPAATTDDALRQVPGFTLFRRSGSRTANPTSQGVSLRGIGASGASRAVVLDDGVPLNDPFGGWIYWGRVPRAAIGRVEVLRGGASDLYGSAAMGGVINFIRRDTGARAFSLDATAGSDRTGLLSLFAAGTLGGFEGSIAAEGFTTDGYVAVDRGQRGLVDVRADSRHETADATLVRTIGSVRLFGRGSYYGERRNNGTPLQTNDTQIRQFAAGVDVLLAGGAFTGRAFASRQHYDQTFSAIAADRNSERLTVAQKVPSRGAGATAQWSRALGKRQALLAGAEWRDVQGSSDEQQFAVSGARTFVSSAGSQRSLAAFLQDIVTPSPKLTLSATLRWDGWRNFDAVRTTIPPAPLPATRTPLASRSDDALTPRLSMIYRWTDRVSTTAAAYKAFRAPTLNELYRGFRVGNVQTQANEHLGPERLTGFEAGARLATRDGRGSLRATLFLTTTDSTIANVTLTSTPTLVTRQRQNLGSSRSRGLELDGDWRLAANWILSGGYLFSDAVVRDFAANRALEGKRLPQVPRNQATLQLRHAGTSAGNLCSRLTVGIETRLSGAQFEDDTNDLPLRGYFVADLFAAYPIAPRVELTLAAENVFDRRYDIGATPVTTIGPGRAVRVGVRVR
jgi:outer membrane receptor protein involved in Fe transport